MIKIRIITLGRLKEKYLREAQEEYLKRLSAYASVDLIELEPIRLPEKPGESEIEKALSKEAELIGKKIPEGALVAALCIEGRQYSSEELSELIENKIGQGTGNLVFIIGSSHGLHPSVKARASLKLSFSKMTFPHQLFRIMLLEQVYRCFKISEGSGYHK